MFGERCEASQSMVSSLNEQVRVRKGVELTALEDELR